MIFCRFVYLKKLFENVGKGKQTQNTKRLEMLRPYITFLFKIPFITLLAESQQVAGTINEGTAATVFEVVDEVYNETTYDDKQ